MKGRIIYKRLQVGGMRRRAALSVAAMLLLLISSPCEVRAISPERASLLSSLTRSDLVPQERYRAGGELSRGKFLVASRRIRDPRFMETVVLLTQHDGHGTVGLIINRPTRLRLSDIFPEIKERPGKEHYAFIGGPVGMDRIQLLIYFRSRPSKSQRIFDNVYVSSNKALLDHLAKGPKTGDLFRVYAGYAGWVPGQLDREVLRGDWRVVQADAESIFSKEPADIWPDLISGSEIIRIKLQR
jgi:putative transcriptional regulator